MSIAISIDIWQLHIIQQIKLRYGTPARLHPKTGISQAGSRQIASAASIAASSWSPIAVICASIG
jgi:hypothetical protein